MGTGKYDFSEAINTFFIESRELLEGMENALLELEKDINDREQIPAIFRAVHTIKGSAGMFGFNDIGDFSHVVEDLLDNIRNNKIVIIPEMLSLLLQCHDHILKLLDFFDTQRDAKITPELKKESDTLLDQLNIFLLKPGKKKSEKDIIKEDTGELSEIQVMNECWHISLRFGPDLFKNGFDPQSFILFLSQMGKLVKIKTITETLPLADKMDPETCYLGFEISFMGYTTKEKIEEVFEFVRDDSTIRILPPKSSLTEYVRLIDGLSEEPKYIGEILTGIGSLTKKELEDVLKLQSESAKKKDKKTFGEIAVEEKMVEQPVIDAAVNKQTNIKKAEEKVKQSMRIDTAKLDILINLVGELVISSANMEQQTKNIGDTKLIKTYSQMTRLIDNIRETSMKIRMVQIGESFKKFERVVRDISRERGKKVELVLNGGETELDKTIVEKVTDPLMHLVRNAVDHGIDLPEERISKGKPATGRVTLNAYHEAGNMVIEISDDGSGLKKDKILNKAIEKGLIRADEISSVTDNDLFQFIFKPGFSTADKVTEISGRGVGMDVVKKNIELLRGSVVIQSREGQGTMVRINLPLTLAIIDGFLVRTGKLYCVFPLALVSECTNISKTQHELIKNENGDFINLKGKIIPFVRLRDFFKIEDVAPERESIVIIEHAKEKTGFIVDETFGEVQTVVKPMGKLFKKLEWVSGATILGGGEVGLILDAAKFIQYLQAIDLKKVS